MQAKLSKNNYKGGWKNESVQWLIGRLHQEIYELEEAILHKKDKDYIINEASDVANFAMMIADKVRNEIRT
jgi:NTP pyrophosphatase (non-canonical NTP hydrolase)